MKTILILITSILITGVQISAQKASDLLRDAVYQEEITGDLKKAISIYTKILEDHPDERPVAAEALYRLGLSYEKQGKAKASVCYERIVSSYSDQGAIAQMAKQRLALLQRPERTAPEDLNLTHSRIATLPDIYGSISPNGRYISFINWWNEGNLAVHDIQTGKSRDLTDEGKWAGISRFGDHSIWSPDNQKIAYVWYTGKEPVLKIFDLPSGRIRTLVDNKPGWDFWPLLWAPNNRIYYRRCRGDCEEIALYDVDVNSGNSRLIKEIDRSVHPGIQSVQLSPTLDLISFTEEYGKGKRRALIFPFPEIPEKPVTVIENINAEPIWSADGSALYYSSTRYDNAALYKQPLKNGKISSSEVLVLESLPKDFLPSSVDLQTGDIYYTSKVQRSLMECRKLDWKTRSFGPAEELINSDDGHWGPSWSPDGIEIAYVANTGIGTAANSLYIRDTKSGKTSHIDRELRLLKTPQGFTQLQWTPDSRKVLIDFRPLDEEAKEMYKTAFIETETGELDLLKGLFPQGGKGVLSENELIYYERGQGLILLNRASGERELIYSSNDPKLDIWYLSFNKARNRLVFFEGDKFEEPWIKRLVLLDLESGNSSVLWTPGEDLEFSPRNQPMWGPDDKTLLLSLIDRKRQLQQFYTYHIFSGEKRAFGPSIPQDKNWMNVSLKPDGTELVYVRYEGWSTAWAIRNIPE